MQSPDETCRRDAAQGAEHGEQDKHEQCVRIDRHGLKRRHEESGRIAKEPAAHERRRPRRDRDRKERLHAHLGHHQLDGEHHPADWRIEGGRDTRACARSDQSDPLARRHADYLAKRGAERRADLDDRTFPPDRRTAADRDGRSQGFDQRHNGSDDAALVVNGVHHFWDPMAFGLGGKIGHQEGHADGAQHRNQDYQRAPRRGRGKDVCVVVDDRVTGK